MLPLSGVPDCIPGGVDPAEQCRLRNNAAVPDRCQEVVLADDAVAVPDQVDQNIEDLRFHSHQLASAAQLSAIRIERTVLKQIEQDAIPLFRRPVRRRP